ncbi:hypothetical protein ANN_03560 [Periplaneta americana]|uniref:Endonuclease/exonuclease/phosphatase domain-containing protein n=1 Tax=Periplaneta americana TaxID=6978 RepID=A0ABQ8U3M0_PERAM|nr:hypothetical protein ANN_03560 [Periplaneta americana]
MYYKLVPRNITINANIYRQQLRRLAAASEEKRQGRLHQVVLQHDNAHQELVRKSALEKAERIYTTVILQVVLYDCETWTFSLREEQKLRMFENQVLRKIFGAKRNEVTGERRKLHNSELHTLCWSPDIIRNIESRCLRWAGHIAHMGESRNSYRVLVGRPEGKIPLGRPRRRLGDNIKIEPIRGGPPAWGLDEGLTTHHRKKQLVTNSYNKRRNGTDSLALPQQRNKVMRFGTWNVTSLYRTGGVTLVAKELARYRIDFVGIQELTCQVSPPHLYTKVDGNSEGGSLLAFASRETDRESKAAYNIATSYFTRT